MLLCEEYKRRVSLYVQQKEHRNERDRRGVETGYVEAIVCMCVCR